MLAERRTLALIGTQRREALLCLQDSWVQAKRKGKRGPRVESKEKACFPGGVELRLGRRKRKVAWGEAGQGRVGCAESSTVACT